MKVSFLKWAASYDGTSSSCYCVVEISPDQVKNWTDHDPEFLAKLTKIRDRFIEGVDKQRKDVEEAFGYLS